MKRPSIVLQPRAGRHLLRGLDLIADAVRPTLGPIPRYVAYRASPRSGPTELIDNAAAVARRIDDTGDSPSDAGAMLLREAIRQVNERVGDGGATTAVLAQALARQAHRSLAAGANAMRVREGLRRGVDAAATVLRSQAVEIRSRAELSAIARALCGDDELARVLGEIYSVVGAEGYIDIRAANGRVVERNYVEGACWRANGLMSTAFLDKGAQHAIVQDTAVILVDGWMMKTNGLERIIGQALEQGYKAVTFICLGMSEVNRGILAHNHQKGEIRFLPIQTPYMQWERESMLEDIAVLTGATVLGGSFEPLLDGFMPEMIGTARRIWADTTQFGVIGGKGGPKALREHIGRLRHRLARAKDKEEKERLRVRVGRLLGGTAVLHVGAATEAEQKTRLALANRTARFLRAVAGAGMVPGGGAAYLACQDAVKALPAEDEDVAAGVACVVRALEEPMRAIARNAGVEEKTIVARARERGTGFGLNALTGEIVDMRRSAILDSAEVLEQALLTAGSVATMLITTDVIVRHRNPPKVYED